MIEVNNLRMLAQADGRKLSENADELIKAINKNHGYCLKHKAHVHELKKHEHEELQCPCYKYRKEQNCILGLFV